MIANLLAIAVCLTAPAVYAIDYHENPDSAQEIFSAISLLRYYSDSLDLIIQKDPEDTETFLGKMPFANIPQDLEKATSDFASSGIELSRSVKDLSQVWERQNALIGQFRLDEAIKLAAQISDRLPQARTELMRLAEAVEATGEYLKLASVPPQSGLRVTYDEIQDKIRRLGEMLDLFGRPLLDKEKLAELLKSTNPDLLAELLKSGNPDLLAALLKPTSLTLNVTPLAAFVGDEIEFEGVLSAQGKPLAEREIDILLNSAGYVTVKTDAQGHYHDKLVLPYWYIPELEVQVIYYPQGEDIGLYLGSSSPAVRLLLEFYQSKLEIKANGPAYPERETTLIGSFDYGDYPLPEQRRAEIYLDDARLTEFTAQQTFAQEIRIDSQIKLGKHTFSVSVAAQGRYSPVVASCILEVSRATPILDLDAPRIAIIPGTVALRGQLYSEIGPLKDASIAIGIGTSEVPVTTASDGSFDARIKVGMGLSLIGSQVIAITVQPQEPWHAPLVATRSIFMINAASCGIMLAVLAVLTLYLPRRFRKWYGRFPERTKRMTEIPLPEPVRVYGDNITIPSAVRDSLSDRDEPANSVSYWYRLALRLVQSITQTILRPQQTLREYARESSQALGPAGKYFLELTHLIERLLYSTHRPTPEDLAAGERLSQAIKEEAKGENI